MTKSYGCQNTKQLAANLVCRLITVSHCHYSTLVSLIRKNRSENNAVYCENGFIRYYKIERHRKYNVTFTSLGAVLLQTRPL